MQQIKDASQTNSVVKKAVAALAHFQNDIFDFTQAMSEIPLHVLAIKALLILDGLDGARILFQQVRPLLNHAARLSQQTLHDSQRRTQFEANALNFIKRVKKVVLKWL